VLPGLSTLLDSDFENLVKTSRRFLRHDGMLKRGGREGLRRANSVSLASASSAGTSAPFALKQHCPRNFKSLWLELRATRRVTFATLAPDNLAELARVAAGDVADMEEAVVAELLRSASRQATRGVSELPAQ